MKKIRQTMERTRVIDRTLITKEALQSLVDQTNKYYISVWNGHDPRLPPVGRVIAAELEQTGKNSFEAVGEIEIFDETTSLSEVGIKEIATKEFDKEYIQLEYDKNFLCTEDQNIISEISSLLSCDARKEEKHCVDHVAIISLGASFLFGGIAAGFLNKLGEDSYITLKEKLTKLLQKKKGEKVLALEFCVEKDGYLINVEAFSTNPSPSDIGYMLTEGISDLESNLLPSFYNKNLAIRRLVFEQEKNNVKLKFAVRKDGIPMKFETPNNEK